MELTVFARVYLTGQGEDQVNHFSEEIGKLSQVVECHLMAGDCDFCFAWSWTTVEDIAGLRVNDWPASRACSASKPTYRCRW